MLLGSVFVGDLHTYFCRRCYYIWFIALVLYVVNCSMQQLYFDVRV